MGPIGPLELVIVLIILLVIFGPKRLPGLGKSLGTGMREFKDSISGGKKDDDDERDGNRAALSAGAGSTTLADGATPAEPVPAEPVPARGSESATPPSQVPTEPRA